MLHIVRGLPGSGKSTFCHYMFPGMFHVENDMGHITDTCNYKFDKERILEVQTWCHDAVRLALQNSINCCVSNVFVSKKSIDSYVAIAVANNTPCKIWRLESMFKNNHDVPEEVFQSMKDKFENYEGETIIDASKLFYSKFITKKD